jgi:hypothetical protein
MSVVVHRIGRLSRVSGGGIAVTLEAAGRRHELWYSVSGGPVASGEDTMLCAGLIPAMRIGEPLQLPGRVSPRLLRQAATIQDIMATWFPTLRRVAIEAQPRAVGSSAPAPSASVPSASVGDRGVGCMFSAGVDSFYSLLKHRDRITHLIFMHGHDIPLDEPERYARIAGTVRQVAQAMGKQLIEVSTNLREFSDPHAEWAAHYFGAALASVATLLAPQLREVIVPSSCDYAHLVPWGSHPMVDPLWSTEAVEIVHDGCESTRLQKVRRIAELDVVRRTLRVCLRDRGEVYNCGACEKCLRTMSSLRAIGALGRTSAFPPLDLARVARIDASSVVIRGFIQENLDAARRAGDRPLAEALQDALDRVYSRGVMGWPRRARRLLGKVLRGRGATSAMARSSVDPSHPEASHV